MEILEKLFADRTCTGLAILDRRGQTIFLNEFFRKYLKTNLQENLLSPPLEKIVLNPQAEESISGYITLGSIDSKENISFKGLILYSGEHIYIVIEPDSKNEKRVSAKLASLLQENTNLRRELIKKQKITESQLKTISEINEEKNKFIGFAAHDLRNPIGLTVSYADMLLTEPSCETHPEVKEMIEEIYKQGEFSLRLINDLLDISKIESGTLALQPEKVYYKEFVDQVISQMGLFTRHKNLTLFHSSELSKVLNVEIDPDRYSQVLQNLITNAINYSESNTVIRIKSFSEDGFICTSIIDTGPGIPSDKASEIFEPFCISGVSPGHKYKSTGLGLTIVKKIVAAHKGNINVKNEEGSGACFTILLPIDPQSLNEDMFGVK
ncbi:MAG: HAMP domain-containing histidine kinase [Bacteroidales bacterium]|nr:HAMP domain-containing histidine kinase [Bacteroidales bacterium]MCF8456586.1 HAMP domain-containing histidine kinase [Bacteroidales bacterium]